MAAPPSFRETFPRVAGDLLGGLRRRGREDLVGQIPGLVVYSCGVQRPSGLGWVDLVPDDQARNVMGAANRERIWLVRRDHVKWPMRVEVVGGSIWVITLDDPRNLKPDLERVGKMLAATGQAR